MYVDAEFILQVSKILGAIGGNEYGKKQIQQKDLYEKGGQGDSDYRAGGLAVVVHPCLFGAGADRGNA